MIGWFFKHFTGSVLISLCCMSELGHDDASLLVVFFRGCICWDRLTLFCFFDRDKPYSTILLFVFSIRKPQSQTLISVFELNRTRHVWLWPDKTFVGRFALCLLPLWESLRRLIINCIDTVMKGSRWIAWSNPSMTELNCKIAIVSQYLLFLVLLQPKLSLNTDKASKRKDTVTWEVLLVQNKFLNIMRFLARQLENSRS